MEALSASLQPYKQQVASAASIMTILQFFSGAFICKDIYKKGNTDGINPMPFVGGSVIGILMLQYAVFLNDPAMIQVNFAGIGLNILYLSCYFYFAKKKSQLLTPLSYGAGLIAILLGYARVEQEHLVEYRFGFIVTALMLCLIGAPLLEVGEIVRTKNADKLPIPIILSATVVTFLWLLYGIILRNDFMVFQNVVGFALCAIQVTLYALYHGGKPDSKHKSKSGGKRAKPRKYD